MTAVLLTLFCGDTSSLLQCDASDVAQPCYTARCTCTVKTSCCNSPHHVVYSYSADSALCVCVRVSCQAAQILGWDSSVAPPDLQGSGTSAMQKSIYSRGVTGRERERGRQRDTDRQRDRRVKGDREEGQDREKQRTIGVNREPSTEKELETNTRPTECNFLRWQMLTFTA